VWEKMRCACPCLYRSKAGDSCGTRGIAITSCAEVGDGRAPREASPICGRRLSKRHLGASTGSAEKTHQGYVARRNVRPDASGYFTRPRSVYRDASEAHIWTRFTSPRTIRSLYVAPLKVVPDTFLARRTQTVAQRPFASPRVRDALIAPGLNNGR
jgi:hypothetical protein